MDTITLSTIGFTKTSAEHFFNRIKQAEVRRLIDVRLHNGSQLSGFAKGADLPFFLKSICNTDYKHEPLLAPTDDILKAYKRDKGDWSVYEKKFMALMEQRKIENKLKPALFEYSCLLCSEDKPHYCHRRLVCDYLNGKWGGVLQVKHL